MTSRLIFGVILVAILMVTYLAALALTFALNMQPAFALLAVLVVWLFMLRWVLANRRRPWGGPGSRGRAKRTAAVRPAISDLVALGRFPDERTASQEDVAARERLVVDLEPPATEEEARALIGLFGDDSLFGLAWTLVQLIESAPGWPYWDELNDTVDPWRSLLRQSAINADLGPDARP